MRNWSVFAGRVGDVELRIHVTFLFLLLFVVLGEANHGATAMARGFALAAMILGVVLLHELGHAIVASRNGFPIKGVVLLPVGGIAVVDPNVQTESARNLRRESQIAFSGPLVNLFLAGLSGLVLLGKGPAARLWAGPLVSVTDLNKSFFWINLALFAINLLPAFPLDGGRIFRAWLARRIEFRQATRRAVTLGHLFSALFMLAGALGQQWLMLVGFFIFMAAQMEERSVMFQSVVEDIHMEDIMLTEFSTLSPADTLEDALNKAVHCLQDDFPVVSGGDLVGVITRQIILDRLRSEGNGYVQGAMTRAFEIASRTESLGSAFRKLTSRGLSLIPVVDQERLVGIVTLQNLMHSMGLWAESRRLRRQMEDRM